VTDEEEATDSRTLLRHGYDCVVGNTDPLVLLKFSNAVSEVILSTEWC